MKWLRKLFCAEPMYDLGSIPNELADPCDGCVWKALKRHQKCSTCRRNQNMKDNYEPAQAAQEGGVERG